MYLRIVRTILRNVLFFGAMFAGVCCSQSGPADPLAGFNDSVDALIRKVAPSVVQVTVSGYSPQSDSERANSGVVLTRQRSIGSGFAIDSDGYVMTNAHVVSGAERIEVTLATDPSKGAIAAALSTKTNTFKARVVGLASDIDIALLRVDGVKLPALSLAPYSALRQGELVFAFGSPGGFRNTVSHGLVSAVARQRDLDSPQISIQTDAPISPGNSGGPLINIKGEVVGMNTFTVSQSGENEGLGFAIPSATLRVAYRQLKQFGRLRGQDIGITMQTITPEMAKGLQLCQDWGVIISDARRGGPAEKAGIHPGDVLVSVDHQPAENVPTVNYNFMQRDSGEKVNLEVLRNRKKLTFDVPVVDERSDIDAVLATATPQKNLIAQLGILGVEIDSRIAPLVPELRHPYGIIVAARTSEDIPLASGDVILSVNNIRTTTLDGLRTALQALSSGDPAVLQIEREGKLLYVTLVLD
jgi:serine protease Do